MATDVNLFKSFDPKTGEVPIIARSLFQAAADTARAHLTNVTTDAIKEQYSTFLDMVNEQVSGIDVDDIEESNILGPELFHNPAHNTDIMAFLSSTKMAPNFDSPLADMAANLTDNAFLHFMSIYLLSIVADAKAKENELLDQSPSLEYKIICEALDSDLHQLHAVFAFLQHLPTGMEFADMKDSYVKRSLKGVEVRRDPFEELRRVALEEHDDKYSELSAAKAARKIVETLGPAWLNDSEGNPISVDPVPLITKWIRHHRAS